MYSLHFCRSALGGLPQKSCFRRCIAQRSFYYLEKKETSQPPLIEERRRLLPSVCARWPSASPTSCAAAWPMSGYRLQRRLLLLHDRPRFRAS